MKSSEFLEKLQDITENYKTLYVMGCFGAPLNSANKERYIKHHPYNTQPQRAAMIRAANGETFGFDCVCLIKGVLWGWNGDTSKNFGGAGYAVNGVPDLTANGMIAVCRDVSTDFGSIVPGEALWCEGHIGIYIGDGLAVECTPSWKNCVQITSVGNIGVTPGYPTRNWTKHGKLPYLIYGDIDTKPEDNTQNHPQRFQIGDRVRFIGKKHYTASNTLTGSECLTGLAKVTMISKGAKHPYHLVREIGGGSTVYGWVDAADVTSISTGAGNRVKVGSTVKLQPGTKTYGGKNLARYVFEREYTVKEIERDRVVLVYNGVVVAAVALADLILIS